MQSPVKAILAQQMDTCVRCNTCIRRCILRPGQLGLCGNYENIRGVLYNVGYGLVSAFESRPIEIKPLFHFYPGSTAMTFSGWGCNFLCPWCQNWHLSKRKPVPGKDEYLSPEIIVEEALRAGDKGVCASFNEPTIHLEYIIDVLKMAKRRNLYTTIVSNGSYTAEALELLVKAGLDAVSLDIKGCTTTYKKFIGIPDPEEILEVASKAKKLGVHIEAVFLIVPGANDDPNCIKYTLDKILEFLGPETPLHINRYFPAYKYTRPPTPVELLVKIRDKALSLGFRYVYIGNIATTHYLHTRCPGCGTLLVLRTHYSTLSCNLKNHKCPNCGYEINLRGSCQPTPS